MAEESAPEYKSRTVGAWLDMAERGELALPTFQRSYVWRSRQFIQDYVEAVFQNRPTGLFLIVKTSDSLQLESRSLRGIDIDVGGAEELLLDGQQRLTSLWQVLNGRAGNVSYYAKVRDLSTLDMQVVEVVSVSDRSADGKAWKDARQAFAENLIPLSILRNRTEQDPMGDIWGWCKKAAGEPDHMVQLRDAVIPVGEELRCRRELHYCELPASTGRRAAIDIFVQSNRSSVRVNEFDIAVALALDEGELELRDRVADFHGQSDVTKYYVNASEDDDEAAISPLGEWAFFSACLSEQRVPPKKARYEEVVKEVFGQGNSETKLDGLLRDVEAALNKLAEHGAPIRRMLPAVPALHVLSGLQGTARKLAKAKANAQNIGNRLISAYLWRAFFSDRYEARANDALYEDYIGLRECIEKIRETGRLDERLLPPIFEDEGYPVADEKLLADLKKPVPWIGSGARLGKALAAIQLAEDPIDWVVENTKLNAAKVRALDRGGELDRHHVFPRKLLKGLFEREQINHGLNGVLLCKPTNQSLSQKDPVAYLEWIREQPAGPTGSGLRARVESHLVPYDAIVCGGNLAERYEKFIRRRAKIVAKRIKERCKV